MALVVKLMVGQDVDMVASRELLAAFSREAFGFKARLISIAPLDTAESYTGISPSLFDPRRRGSTSSNARGRSYEASSALLSPSTASPGTATCL